MPVGIYKRTPEMYISRKGMIAWNKDLKGFNAGHPGYCLGKKFPNRKRPIYKKRKPLSEETKLKIKLKVTGHKHTKEAKIKIGLASKGNTYCLGKKASLETRIKKKEAMLGEKNHQWRGGLVEKNLVIRHSLEYRLWRESVFQRDNYTCIWCGDNRGGNLEADHIRPFALFPELRFVLENGRTLCINCHKTTNTYGKKILTYAI